MGRMDLARTIGHLDGKLDGLYPGRRLEGGERLRKYTVAISIVRIEEADILASRLATARVSRLGGAAMPGVLQHAYPRPPACEAMRHGQRLVGGCVVDDQDLRAVDALFQDRIDRICQRPRGVIAGDHHRDLRPAGLAEPAVALVSRRYFPEIVI